MVLGVKQLGFLEMQPESKGNSTPPTGRNGSLTACSTEHLFRQRGVAVEKSTGGLDWDHQSSQVVCDILLLVQADSDFKRIMRQIHSGVSTECFAESHCHAAGYYF